MSFDLESRVMVGDVAVSTWKASMRQVPTVSVGPSCSMGDGPVSDYEKDVLVANLAFLDRMGRWPTFVELETWMGDTRRSGLMWKLRRRGLAGWDEDPNTVGLPHGLTVTGALYAAELTVERSSSV